ncbi:MAG: TonB-dependent receptor [Bryobacterales bacterium]|nr:TonB-dependent receptor [Bryobacterales bacterium]
MKKYSCGAVAAALLVLAMYAPKSKAQVLYGTLVGNVRDATDAALPEGAITLTNRSTNQVREAATGADGLYNFPNLLPGTYELKVTKQGFRAYVQTGIEITVNTVTRADVTMQVGSVAESIEVTAQTVQLQSDRAEVRAEIGAKELENLPVAPGRNYQQLFKTIPGFRPPTNAHSVPTNPSRALTFNVNGASYAINNTKIDGASSIAPWLPHATAFVPTLEAVEVVNVVTNSFDAEQGLAGGAAINVAIKSGTNDLHGALFEFHSNNKLKAKNFFLPQGQANPKLVVNEFGGALGGPIKRDKLFFFGSYEANLNREFASRFGTVPTAAMKAGNMSESPRLVYDPNTGTADGFNRVPLPGNIVPAARISPIIKKLVDLTPAPNLDGLANNFFAAGSYLYDRHRFDTKVNYNHSQKLTAFGRFSFLDYSMDNPMMFGALGGPEISSAGGNPGVGSGRTYSFTGSATYIISQNFLVDSYYGWTRMDTNVEQPRLDEKLGTDFLGIPGVNGTRRFEGGWPQFNVSSFTAIGMPNAFMPYFRSDPQYQWVSNFNVLKRTHEVRFGFELYKTGMNHQQPEATGALYGASGGFGFGGGPTQLNGGLAGNQFNSYATFLMGITTNKGKITQVPDVFDTRSFQAGFYVRDRWNVNRRLTLNYGMRWEYFPFPTRSDRGLELYDIATNKMSVCGVGNVPRNCGVVESKRKFAPRAGLAYRVTDTFVIRAGYGLTNDPFSLQRPFRTNYPVLLIDNYEAPNSFGNTGLIAQGIPTARVPDFGNGVIDIPGTFAVITADKNFRRGYVQSWNFTMQKQLQNDFTVGAGYVATRSTNQMGYLDYNAGQVINGGQAGRPLFAQFGRTSATNVVQPFGTTMYDSLQATALKRMAPGFALNMAYTWSKVIGYVDNNDGGPSVQSLVHFERNRTVRNYDRTHNLQISNIWELPFGKGQKWATDGVGAKLLGGWQVNNILSFFTGAPFTVTSGGATLNMPGATQTADQVKDKVQKLGGVGRGTPFYDPTAFIPVARNDRRFGNTAMNLLRGPGSSNWDLSIFRRFQVSERFKLEFRGEAFNFTNTPHFNNPGGNVDNFNPEITNPLTRYGGYMEITSTAGLGRDGIDERQVRLGLRLSF